MDLVGPGGLRNHDGGGVTTHHLQPATEVAETVVEGPQVGGELDGPRRLDPQSRVDDKQGNDLVMAARCRRPGRVAGEPEIIAEPDQADAHATRSSIQASTFSH